jgi:hypothetical protein
MADQKPPEFKPLPPHLANLPGVSFNRPPDHLILDISRVVNDAVKTLEANKTVAVYSIITDTGANGVFVAKFNETWAITGWLGKEWGSKVTGGAVLRATW